MAQETFTLDIFIAVEPAIVRTFAGTLQNHRKIHPLVLQIVHTGRETRSDGIQEDSYFIRDRILPGPFPCRITYRAVVRVDTTGEVISDVYQFLHIHLHNAMSFLASPNGTYLIERVEIEAPWLLMPVVHKLARQSHRVMLANLKKLLENGLDPV